MNSPKRIIMPLIVFFCFLINNSLFGQKLDEFEPAKSTPVTQNQVQDVFQFNGYTNYWHDSYDKWIRYGNLFKMTVPDVLASIAQSKVDIAEDMGVPGLSMQEGFMKELTGGAYTTLDQPSIQQIEQSFQKGNLLLLLDPSSEAGKKLAGKYQGSGVNKDGHQLGASDLVKVDVFFLTKDKNKIFVISSKSSDYRNKVKQLVENTLKVVKDYDLHRGWFGASLARVDTCCPERRLEIIARGMNEGNDWFVFNGLREISAKQEVENWIAKVNLPVITDAGYSPVYGCKNYDNLQDQIGKADEGWIKYAHDRGGYVFHQVADTIVGQFDGFIGGEGNKKQIDSEDVPFIVGGASQGGRQFSFNQGNEDVPSMILFAKKGEKFTREVMWQSILSRREVAVLKQGKLMGPALYRNTLNMLALDREYLEGYYGDRININAFVDGNQLKINLTNTYSTPVSGSLSISLPPELKINGNINSKVDLAGNGTKTLSYQLQSSGNSKVYPIAIHYNWGGSKKSTVAIPD